MKLSFILCLLATFSVANVHSFTPVVRIAHRPTPVGRVVPQEYLSANFRQASALNSSGSDDEGTASLSESDQTVLGVSGTIAALVTLWSEFVLKTTGCGLPAGPAGLLGATEGISYLGIVAIAGFSLYTKIKTGSGLPAGPGGVLGMAEGLSYLSIFVGLVVLVFQVLNYGYIPNAVPMEGGMCS